MDKATTEIQVIALEDIYATLDQWQKDYDDVVAERDDLRSQLELARNGILKAIGYGNRLDIYKVLNNTLAEIDKTGEQK